MYRIYHREATFVANGFEVCKTSKLLLGKVLILLVGNCCLGVLIRGSQNLESSFGKVLILLVGGCSFVR